MGKRARAHVDDYQLDEKGSYVYTGTYWKWDQPERRDGYLRMARVLLGGACACVAAAGIVPAPGTTGAMYVVVPYVAAVIGCALAVASLVKLAHEGDPLRDHVYQKSAATLVPKLVVALVGAVGSAIGILLYGMIASQGGISPMSLGYAALLFAAALCLGHLCARTRELSFSKDARKPRSAG